MLYRDLIQSAIAIVCENAVVSFGNEDYHARAPYLLAAFVTQYAKLDGDYRKANGMENKVISTDAAAIEVDDEFPLCDVFAPAAIYHLAAGLVIDENEEMSMRLFEQYADSISTIQKDLPCQRESITSHYDVTKG